MFTPSDPLTRLFHLLEGEHLGLAESCTGGRVSARITSVAGASEFFKGSVVAYSNEVKEALLKVPGALLERHGAVSEAVARAMARGACRALGASVGGAVTGIAGPGGGTPDKPVGTVFIAVIKGELEIVGKFLFTGDREEIQDAATRWVLDGITAVLLNEIPEDFERCVGFFSDL